MLKPWKGSLYYSKRDQRCCTVADRTCRRGVDIILGRYTAKQIQINNEIWWRENKRKDYEQENTLEENREVIKWAFLYVSVRRGMTPEDNNQLRDRLETGWSEEQIFVLLMITWGLLAETGSHLWHLQFLRMFPWTSVVQIIDNPSEGGGDTHFDMRKIWWRMMMFK